MRKYSENKKIESQSRRDIMTASSDQLSRIQHSSLHQKPAVKHQMKKFVFYNTFVTRQDIINLHDFQSNEQIEKYWKEIVIKRFEDEVSSNSYAKEQNTAFALITFQHIQKPQVSQVATQESQHQCKLEIFTEFLQNVLEYCKKNFMTFEQMSTLFSICFFIFVESLERKITQIDSYELFKKILKSQISLTNTSYLPLFNKQDILNFNDFIVDTFYKYYSIYELRMTIYQEINIFTNPRGTEPLIQMIEELSESEIFDEAQEQNDFQIEQDNLENQQKTSVIREKDQFEIETEKKIGQELDSFMQKLEQRIKENDQKLLNQATEIQNKKK